MARDTKKDQASRTVRTRRVSVPVAANDNEFTVSDSLPDAIAIEEWELEMLESHLSDILSQMIPANDN